MNEDKKPLPRYKKVKTSRKGEEYKSLRFIKAVSETAKKIKERNTKKLNYNDYKEITKKVYKRDDIITISRLRNRMKTEIAQNMINQALITFYNQAELNEEEAIKMLKLAKDTAIEKKDVNNLLKIVEKYESATNLTHKNAVNVSQTQIIDYSKLGKDGQPAVKTVKTIETTINNAQDCDINNEPDQTNDKV
jgi:uncharacterized protein HemY